MEQIYLKVVPKWTEDMIIKLSEAVSTMIDINDHELFDKIYDQNKYNDVREMAKDINKHEKKRPSIVNRLDTAFRNFVHYEDIDFLDYSTIIKCDNVELENTILNAYVNEQDRDSVTLIDADALSIKMPKSNIINSNGNTVRTNVLDCDDKNLYLWFVEHRNPKREIDNNYKKHSPNSRMGKKGVRISPLTYDKKQTKQFMHKAVGSPDDRKNLFYLDNEKNAILVFWDEGILNAPTFHAYQISADDKKEIQKIYKKGSTSLLKKIEKVSEY